LTIAVEARRTEHLEGDRGAYFVRIGHQQFIEHLREG